jgi:hypothetical protein
MKGSAIEKLLRLADEAERTAAAYRLAATALNGHATSKRVERSEGVLDDALAVDAARRAIKTRGRGPDKQKRKRPGEWRAAHAEQRRRTATYLAALDTSKVTPFADWAAQFEGVKIPVAPLVNGGYVKKKGGGYIRTAKVFDPEAR